MSMLSLILAAACAGAPTQKTRPKVDLGTILFSAQSGPKDVIVQPGVRRWSRILVTLPFGFPLEAWRLPSREPSQEVSEHSALGTTQRSWDAAKPLPRPHEETSAQYPSWSPDGKNILFSVHWVTLPPGWTAFVTYNVYTADEDGTNLKNLSNYPDVQRHPWQIWSATSTISEKEKMSMFQDLFPAWSPEGSRIVFSRCWYKDRGCSLGRKGDIWVMNADGSGQRPLLEIPGTNEFMPAFSPDATKVAFSSDKEGKYGLFLVNSDGTGIKRITEAAYDAWAPSWSPDGRTIAFMCNFQSPANFPMNFDYHNGNEICTIAADGTGFKRLTDNGDDEIYPAWSPDGKWIAYGYGSVMNGSGLMIMRPDGGEVRRLLHMNTVSHPSWRPPYSPPAASQPSR